MTTAAQSRDVLGKIDLWLRMYRQMVSIREFEAQVNDLYTRALMPGLAHLYSLWPVAPASRRQQARSNKVAPATRRQQARRDSRDKERIMALPTYGTMAVDWEDRVDFDRLRRERLARAKELLAKSEMGSCCVST
jgi:hypothetical protein